MGLTNFKYRAITVFFAVIALAGCILNLAPLADAGDPQTVTIGSYVRLDGSRSYDANGDVLRYDWTLISQPTNSASGRYLAGADTIAPTFVPDLAGPYIFQLVVSDGQTDSPRAVVVITAIDDRHGQLPSDPPVNNADHIRFSGACVDCHNGRRATGKSPRHILVTDKCESCHSTKAWQIVTRVDHTAITADCDTCHNNITAQGKGAKHPLTTQGCADCHTTSTWLPKSVSALGWTSPALVTTRRLKGNERQNGFDANVTRFGQELVSVNLLRVDGLDNAMPTTESYYRNIDSPRWIPLPTSPERRGADSKFGVVTNQTAEGITVSAWIKQGTLCFEAYAPAAGPQIESQCAPATTSTPSSSPVKANTLSLHSFRDNVGNVLVVWVQETAGSHSINSLLWRHYTKSSSPIETISVTSKLAPSVVAAIAYNGTSTMFWNQRSVEANGSEKAAGLWAGQRGKENVEIVSSGADGMQSTQVRAFVEPGGNMRVLSVFAPAISAQVFPHYVTISEVSFSEASGWSPQTPVPLDSPRQKVAQFYHAAAGANGQITLVWFDGETGATHALYAIQHDPKTGWGVTENLMRDHEMQVDLFGSAVAMNDNGDAIASWAATGTNGYSNLYAVRYLSATGKWGAEELVVQGPGRADLPVSSPIAIGLTVTGKATAWWQGDDGEQVGVLSSDSK